ncbi:retrovirus-related Pol polyprotein from transposon 17.6 [Trichonephila clavipes]|nr:retrovirus-related Pol polyprotein from transposon 17.6 [Trichonephila clavipes]
MNYYNANNEDNINVKNNKGLDQISDSPEADLKRLFNPAMVVEDTIPRQTSEQWGDLTQLLDKFQTIFSQNKPSHSPYAAPVTLAYKKDEGKRSRLCIDYRKLNEITRKDSTPVPLIDFVIDNLTHAKFFSTLDLTSGYWHIKIHEKDAEKLAFTTNFGLYEWLRLPFGWKNSPAVFQRTIRQILQKYQLTFALNYFDDIIIFSQSWEEHLTHLDTIFQICKKENIKLKKSKCQFAQEKIKFLGYEITQGHYSPSNPNIETIRKLAPPKDVKELQRFLGSINVYQKFIKDYAKLRVPLNKLLKKDAIWNWSHECQEAYQKLKNCLISKPILKLYNSQYPCHVFCDASQESIGVVLKQQHPDGTLYPIAYHSRQLLKHEKNYTISEKECLAIIDALDKFHCYLHGSKFTIHTDHAALQWLKSVKHLTGRLFRWSLKLSQYEYSIVYIKGKLNVEADMLSRNPVCHYISPICHF